MAFFFQRATFDLHRSFALDLTTRRYRKTLMLFCAARPLGTPLPRFAGIGTVHCYLSQSLDMPSWMPGRFRFPV
ncbi:hypothetical protein DPMN_127972 [Dreissena polymorpha]|uniref:Uncharacterized protein n=1 Tax=Dreissena polymorpha TaxID=45954 RepID=A0A9D4GYK2_DREPO|nr:hypothetical protein DPMN_127972 [Dreissena polymorpha]